MAYRTTYLFIPRNGFLCPHSSGVYLFYPLDITKTSRSLEALRLQPLGRTTAVFSMVLDLFFPKHCVHKDTARYVLSYSKPFELLTKNCLIIGNSSPKSLYLDNNQNDTREYKNK